MTWYVWFGIIAVIVIEIGIPLFAVGIPIIRNKIKGRKKDE